MNRPGPPLSPDRWHQIEALFERALDAPAEQRAELLRQACGDDAELRAQVERLLEAEQASAGFLAEPAGRWAASLLEGLAEERTTEPARGEDRTGARFGPYQVLEEIGAGGMSRVYRAVRDDGVFAQTVALKVLRPFGAQREERERRFRVERHLLASLEHPGIARILDGGTGPGGSQYLAMELVDGLPLDRYCAERGLDVAARLRLVVEICAAVQYAHQRLIVHRDLKPANILVDASGRPRLLDFGIAKLLADDQEVSAGAPPTRTGLLLMTPEYAAPEQVRGEPVTTATDVYALGVVLYELLSGRRPFDLAGLRPSEIDELVSHRSPAPLAAHLDPAVMAAGGLSIADLESIVQKALAKEPERRYGSAAELAEDLGRALSGHPVLARPATRRYRWARFVRRHRWSVAAVAAIVAAVLAAAMALVGGERRTRAERNRALAEAAKARQIAGFLHDLFRASDPAEARGLEVTARELLERGLARADALDEDPLAQAQLRAVIGSVHSALGGYEVAEAQLRLALDAQTRALARTEPERLDTALALAQVLVRRGAHEAAAPLFAEVATLAASDEGGASRRALEARAGLASVARARGDYDDAVARYEQLLAEREVALGAEDESVAATLADLADVLVDQGRLDRAGELLARACAILDAALGADHPRSLVAKQRLAKSLVEWGRFDEAERLGSELLALQRRTLGPEHPEVANTLNATLASISLYRGDFATAETRYREVAAIRIAAFGPEHPDVATALGNVGMAQLELGRLAQAEATTRAVLALKRRILEPRHASIASSLHLLAVVLLRTERFAEAEPLLRESLSIRAERLGPRSPRTASSMHDLGVALTSLGRYGEAEALLVESVAIRKETVAPDHPHLWAGLEALAVLYELWDRPEMAAPLRREIAERFPDRAAAQGGE